MFDEMSLLRESEPLQQLLDHYLVLDQAAPEAWQDRRAELPGTTPEELIKLHGHLLAHGWLSINTQAQSGGYRISAAGTRALRRARVPELEEEETLSLEAEPVWKTRRPGRKKAA